MEEALHRLCEKAESAVRAAGILVLSDRGVSVEQAPIPSLLATAASTPPPGAGRHKDRTTLVVETAEAREVHHFALLVGYGATAMTPLAFETLEEMAGSDLLEGVGPEEARRTTSRPSEEVCSRSSPRWASRRSSRTAGPRSSRPSA